jgi:cytidine kinase
VTSAALACVGMGIIIDDIVTADGRQQRGVLGGGGPQTVWGMAAARGSGHGVGLLGSVGQDAPPRLLQPLQAAGVDLRGVVTRPTPTLRAWQMVNAAEERQQRWQSPLADVPVHLDPRFDQWPPNYRRASVFHWGVHPATAHVTLALRLREQGALVSLEAFRAVDAPLPRTALQTLMHACDVFSCNLAEARSIIGATSPAAILHGFAQAGCRCLTVRCGADGSWAWQASEGQFYHVPAYPVPAANVVGAGNAYAGAFAARLKAHGLADALVHASACASYLLQQVGLPPRLPDADDYRQRCRWVAERLSKSADSAIVMPNNDSNQPLR